MFDRLRRGGTIFDRFSCCGTASVGDALTRWSALSRSRIAPHPLDRPFFKSSTTLQDDNVGVGIVSSTVRAFSTTCYLIRHPLRRGSTLTSSYLIRHPLRR
ncbi:unnamed protein product, partial [Ectocarpus fasciculatus]